MSSEIELTSDRFQTKSESDAFTKELQEAWLGLPTMERLP
jgi:hypothetical protein